MAPLPALLYNLFNSFSALLKLVAASVAFSNAVFADSLFWFKVFSNSNLLLLADSTSLIPTAIFINRALERIMAIVEVFCAMLTHIWHKDIL